MCSFCGCRTEVQPTSSFKFYGCRTEVRPTSRFKFCGCRTEVRPTSRFKFCGCRTEVRPTGSFIVKYTRLNNYATDAIVSNSVSISLKLLAIHRYSKTNKNAKQAITNR
jgi:hypothetical protein